MSPGETVEVNIAWAADNDGQPSRGEYGVTSPTSAIGITLLGSSNPDAQISYNWWVSNSDGYPGDWGPWLKANQEKWKGINPYGSGIFFPDSAMGTAGGDRSKYFLLSNGEIDFDQIFTDTLPQVDTSWVPVHTRWAKDYADGIDIRFLYSFGPFDIPPGDSIFAAVALVAGENLHRYPDNRAKNLPENPYVYYENLDFYDLFYNAQRAVQVYHSGYSLPPPGPPQDFVASALGANTIKLTWSPKQYSSLMGYNIYRSDGSTNLSLGKINAGPVEDTFYIDEGLVEGNYYTYWIASVSYRREEGKREQIEALAGRPHAPRTVKAVASKHQVSLSWSATGESDLAGYRIYRTEGDTTLLIGSVGLATSYVDWSVTNGVIYYYRVTAVDSLGLESFFSDSAYALPMAFDQGIGVIDRTSHWYYRGGYGSRSFGDSANAFYSRALRNVDMPCTYLGRDGDYGPWQISLRDLSPFPVVILYSDNLNQSAELGPDTPTPFMLRHYLRAGGKLIFEGTSNKAFCFSAFPGRSESGFCDPGYLRRYDSLLCSYLFLDDAFGPWWETDARNEEFIGALSRSREYPNLEIDPRRVDSCIYSATIPDFEPVMGKLPGVGYMVPKDTSVYPVEVIYTFHSAYDTSELEGKPVAIRYLGDDYKFVFFNFPLYFIKEEQAIRVLHQALSDMGVPTSVEEEFEDEMSAGDFRLEQNYPNPFNLSTTIPFTVHGEWKTVNSPIRITLTIYNILGRKVRTVLNEDRLPGKYRVTWDGKDEKGSGVGSGIYLYRLKIGDYEQTKNMLLLK